MFIEKISLENFRNYERENFDLSKGRNVVFGANAQGKTNFLEAVCFLAAARSFRGAREQEMLRAGEQFASLEAEVALSDRKIVLRAEFERGRRRKLYLNRVKLKTAGEFTGNLRAVIFSPDDLTLVRGGASERRRFMDVAFSQLRPRYADCAARYSRLHEQKTRLLRDYREDPNLGGMLDAFNLQLAATGAAIVRYRAFFVRKMQKSASALHDDISGGERLEMRYRTVSTISDPYASEEELKNRILEHMYSHRAAELASGQALSGPHKDDIELLIDGLPARSFASQGQARTAALALKLAERELMLSESGEEPVLLLDDVLSELDSGRREFVINKLGGGQVIITHCDPAALEGFGGRLFEIDGGRIASQTTNR